MNDDSHVHELLRTILQSFDPPDHLPGFHAELRRRLLEDEFAVRRERRRNRRRRLVAVGAAAAIAAVLAVSGFTRLDGSEVASAAEVRAAVSKAFSQADNMSGVAVFLYPDAKGNLKRWPFSFTLDREGAYRVEDLVGGTVWASDWSTNAGKVAYGEAKGPKSAEFGLQRGLALGSPDAEPFAFFNRGLASIRGGMGEGADPQVTEVDHAGRSAWLLRAAVPHMAGGSGDRLDITVDQETGIPVRAVETLNGEVVAKTLIQDVRINADVPEQEFRIDVPKGAKVHREDLGFRRGSLAGVGARVGYQPQVPGWTPEGYRLAEVQTAASPAALRGHAGTNPSSEAVVMLGYRRGLEYFTVTTRRTGSSAGAWSDPFNRPGTPAGRSEPVIVSGGTLDGVRAELVTDVRSVPHVWVATDKLVVTVGGDLVRDELLRVVGSLR